VAQRRPHAGRRRAGLLAAEGPERGGAGAGVNERRLLDAARAGDEDAFARLTEPHRRALHAHCYRMLGSATDAEDALQEALLNAWRGLPRFEGRSSLRSWLYTIATNACLRAVLILRDVLGFSAREAAEVLETSAPAVDSALQRAHRAVDERLPERSQQAMMRSLDDRDLRELVDRYVDAFERADVDAVVEMLATDGAFTMPPRPTWFRGREAVGAFLADHVLAPGNRWRVVPARASGQLAFGNYRWDDERQIFEPRSMTVFTLGARGIDEMTTFIGPELFARFGLPDHVDS